MVLDERQRDTLKQVCDVFVPSLDDATEFYRRPASQMNVHGLIESAMEGSLQPSNAESLERVLRIFDSRAYNLVLTGRPSRFTSMSPDQKERYLRGWRDSSVPIKRSAFQALKRLSCFLSYASTEPTGSNPNWPEIGYPGPPADLPAELAGDLVIRPVPVDGDLALTCDAVVVGSGAGGSVIAESLAGAGLDVVVVEEGPYETPRSFERKELSMMERLFQQGGTAATKDLSFVLLAGRGAGGGTTVNWNTCLKPPRRVLQEWESEFGIDGAAGPRLASLVDEVWASLKVNDEESQRNENNGVLWEGCRNLGYSEGTDYQRIERNAVGCNQRCDYCTYGCVYGCKQSTSLTYLPRAQSKGARFVFGTRAESVVIEGGRAVGIQGRAVSGGRAWDVSVRARAVVVAAGALETPALLLRSGVKDRNIGRYLRLDPTVAVGGIFPKPIDPWKGPPQTVAVWKFIDLDGTYHGFWVEAAPAHPGLFALSIPWVGGREHKDFMKEYYSRSSATIVLLRERSHGVVKVDKKGFPVAEYNLLEEDRLTLVRGMEETAKILSAAGATGAWTTHNDLVFKGDGERPLTAADLDSFSAAVRSRGVVPNRMMLFSAHLMGSCRMSSDPSAGPTSPTGELHSVKGLYIGDACVFPTTPAVNPMISIMAMAARTAESIKTALRG